MWVIADLLYTYHIVKYCTSGCSVNLYQVSVNCVQQIRNLGLQVITSFTCSCIHSVTKVGWGLALLLMHKLLVMLAARKSTVSNTSDERQHCTQSKGNAYLSSISRAVTLACRASLSSICSSISLWDFLFSPSILSSSVSPSSTCLLRAFTLSVSCNTGWG